MLCIYDCPRVLLENEDRFRAIPEIVEKVFEWNMVPNLRKFVDLSKGVVNLLSILLNINALRFFKGVEIMREL